MTITPVLALPDFSQPFVLQTDASGLGTAWFYYNPIIPNPILVKNYPLSFKILPHILESCILLQLQSRNGGNISWGLQTDHKRLKHLMAQVALNPEQQHYLSKLLGFEYSITCKPGKDNLAVDALSRQSDPRTAQLMGFLAPKFLL